MFAQNFTQMLIAAIFEIATRWKQLKSPSEEERINKVWSVHVAEYYSATTKNEETLRARARMNLENIILSKRSRIQKAT